MVFREGQEAPVDPWEEGVVAEGKDAKAIVMPNEIGHPNDESWNASVPYVLSWATDAPLSSVGEITISVDVEPFGDNDKYLRGQGPYKTLETTKARFEGDGDGFGGLGEFNVTFPDNVNVGKNYFMPFEVQLDVRFDNSDISDENRRTNIIMAIPNEEMNDLSKMVSTANTVWETGVTLADELVQIDLGRMQTLARLWAYSAAADADMVDGSDIPENAVVDGISAFEEPLDEAGTEWRGEDMVQSMGGPVTIQNS